MSGNGISIAVTGVGMTTCLGLGHEANWGRLRAGDSGIEAVTRFDVADYPVRRGGEAPPPLADERAGDGVRVETRHLLGVIREAIGGAAHAAELGVEPSEVGLVVGSSLAGSSTADGFFEHLEAEGMRGADYGLLEDYYIEEELGFLCRHLGIEGPSLLVSNACAAGASSIVQGARWLLSGRARMVIACGYDPLSKFTFAGFGSLMALSSSAVRPFSRNRDGMLLGDGYAALLLDLPSDAGFVAREPLALLSGYGEATDAHHLTHPHPEGAGAALAMRRALERAGLAASDIGYINAHGTGTRPNDISETRAMRQVFGAHLGEIPVSSSKPFFGHTLGGAGTVEAVVTLLALSRGFLPATLNLDDADDEMNGLDLLEHGRAATLRHAMSNSFGFGGSNASLVFSRPEER